jgi:hypothetical protein
MAMTAQWQYQVRLDLTDSAAAESARRKLRNPVLAPLTDQRQPQALRLDCRPGPNHRKVRRGKQALASIH